MQRSVASLLRTIGWSLVALSCGASLGYFRAYLVVGANPNRGRGDLSEAVTFGSIVGAILGTIIGATVAWGRRRRCDVLAEQLASEPWHRKLPVEAILWPLLLFTAALLYAFAPLDVPAE